MMYCMLTQYSVLQPLDKTKNIYQPTFGIHSAQQGHIQCTTFHSYELGAPKILFRQPNEHLYILVL